MYDHIIWCLAPSAADQDINTDLKCNIYPPTMPIKFLFVCKFKKLTFEICVYSCKLIKLGVNKML